MNENTMYNDLYVLALTNMKLSCTHMQPHTQGDQPTELLLVARGWGLSCGFADWFIVFVVT